jgi:dihydropteroate synthase
MNIRLDEAPLIMGILNITPDSFSDGGQYDSLSKALQKAEQMWLDGVDIFDVGGESTRPGSKKISPQEEIDRVIPIIEGLKTFEKPISIDTSQPEVMKAAIYAGANMINDIRALQLKGALNMAAQLNVPICLMHMQGSPQNMQKFPRYKSLIDEVQSFFNRRIKACLDAGILNSNIYLDPGFGFGKTLQHNLQLMHALPQFKTLGFPLLVGLSKKSMFGEITGKPVSKRLSASLGAALFAMQKGASIIRVHDVDETRDIRQLYLALKNR